VIEQVFRTPPVIVVTLVAGGALFILVERICKPRAGIEEVTPRVALLIGIAQSLALIPGVSRVGITIVAGMLQNLRREEAARFSFLLSVPVMLGAGAKKALDLQDLALTSAQHIVLAIGTLSAAGVGWLVIKYLLKFLQNHKLDVFAYYRFALASAVLLWLVA
jgi:undecaprenyl-diphosphatase